MSMPEPIFDAIPMRCNTLHGIIKGGLVEIKCHYIKCTKGKAGVQVFHYFDPQTGELVRTEFFQDPDLKLKGRKK